MKITVQKNEIITALTAVQPAAATRTTIPIMSNILIVASGGKLTLTATDLDLSIVAKCDAEVIQEGETTLPARRFFAICKEIGGSIIAISVDDKDKASISSGSSKFSLEGLSADQFPVLPDFSEFDKYEEAQDSLCGALRKTIFSASTDESRMALTGANMTIGQGKLTVAATDGRRLALVELDSECKNDAFSAIIPQKTSLELIKNLNDCGTVEIRKSTTQIMFAIKDTTIISKLIDGTYPNYRQVIPRETGEKIGLNRNEFMSAVRRVSLMLDDPSLAVHLYLSEKQIKLSASSHEIGEATETIQVQYTGPEISTAFNPAFLIAPFKQLDCDTVSMSIMDNLSPGVITSDSFLYVIMPVRVK